MSEMIQEGLRAWRRMGCNLRGDSTTLETLGVPRDLIDRRLVQFPQMTFPENFSVLVLGGGAIGRAIATCAYYNGARVAVTNRSIEKALDSAAIIWGVGKPYPPDTIIPLVCDGETESLSEIREYLFERWGRVDAVISTIGGNMSKATLQPKEPFSSLDPDAYREIFETNVTKGAVNPFHVFADRMGAQGIQSSFVFTGSMAAIRALSRVGAYGAAKAQVHSLVLSWAVSAAERYGEMLRVNVIAPGFVPADQNSRLLFNEDGTPAPRGQAIINMTPFKRFSTAIEIAGPALYLANPLLSGNQTGTIVPVDGGFSAFSGVSPD